MNIMSIAVMVFAGLLLIVSAVFTYQSFRQKAESAKNHGRLPKSSRQQFWKRLAMGVFGIVLGGCIIGVTTYAAYSSQTAKAPEDAAQGTTVATTTPSDATPQETEEEKAAREAKEQEEREKKKDEESEQVREEAAGNSDDQTGDDDNYIPKTVSDEQWELLFGRIDPSLRHDSLSSLLVVRSHLSGFSRPVGLMPVADHEWIEARFLGIAHEGASEEIVETAKKGAELNLLDDDDVAEALAELDEKVKIWETDFEQLSKEKQGIKFKLDHCDLIMTSPIWAEQFLQFVEKHDYFTANYGDVVKDLREYFDSILLPKDQDGNLIPQEEAEAQGLGWNTVYEYADGHEGELAYRQTTEAYRKAVTPLCLILLDGQYAGIVEKPLYRNWELDPSNPNTSFLVTTLAKKIDSLKAAQIDWLAKDGKTVNVSMHINWYDDRIGEYEAARKSKIAKDDDDYVPPQGGGGSNGGGGSTPKPPQDGEGAKDRTADPGYKGNDEGGAGVNTGSDGTNETQPNVPDSSKVIQNNQNNLNTETQDTQGGKTDGKAPSVIGNDSKDLGTEVGKDQQGQDVKPEGQINGSAISEPAD